MLSPSLIQYIIFQAERHLSDIIISIIIIIVNNTNILIAVTRLNNHGLIKYYINAVFFIKSFIVFYKSCYATASL